MNFDVGCYSYAFATVQEKKEYFCVLIANYAGLSLWDLIRLDRDK